MPKESRTPSYRLHRGSGQAVVTLGGRDHYLGGHGTAASRAQYNRLVAEWLANGRVTLPSDRTATTGSELMAAYLRFANGYYRKNAMPTKETLHIKHMMRVLKPLYGRHPVTAFGPLALKTFRDQIIRRGRARTYVNDTIGRVKRMFRWGVENELVPPSVYQGLQAVVGLRRGRSEARETMPIRPVPDEFVDAVKPFVSRPVWTMIELQRLTGMRSGEVVRMRRCELDMSGSIWLYRPGSHKTEHHGHERVVELGPRAQGILTPFLKSSLDAGLFSPRDAVAEQRAEKRRRRKTRVQPSQQDRSRPNPKRMAGDRYTPDSYRRAIQRACNAADAKAMTEMVAAGKQPGPLRIIPRWHPHQLRHNYATRIRKEFGIEAARILLGHRSAAVTELYAEVDRTRVRDIVRRVG